MDGVDDAQVFVDSSLSEHEITAHGNAKTEDTEKKFGPTSGYFDGTGDYLSALDSDDWYFGDGANMFNVSVATVLHTYYLPGDYTVTLIAAPGSICADTISKDIFVQQVFASFAADQTTDCKVPFTVHFTDQSSSNVTNWYWDFWDGQTSTQQNPSNTYQDFGLDGIIATRKIGLRKMH